MTRKAGFFGLTVGLLLVVLSIGTPTIADEAKVRVRPGEHAGFGRIVFDWPAPIGYEVRMTNDQLVVSFAQPGRFDLTAMARDLEDYVEGANVADDGTAVRFPLKGTFELRHFRLGPKIVLDLLDQTQNLEASLVPAAGTVGVESSPAEAKDPVKADKAAPPPIPAAPADPPQPEAASGPAVRVRVGDHPGFSRLVFDWPAPVAYKVEQAAGRITIRFDRPAKLDLTRYRADPPVHVKGLVPRPLPGGTAVELAVPAGVKLRHYKSGGQVVIDVLGPDSLRDTGPSRPADEGTGEKVGPSSQNEAETKPAGPISLLPDALTREEDRTSESVGRKGEAAAPVAKSVGKPVPLVPGSGGRDDKGEGAPETASRQTATDSPGTESKPQQAGPNRSAAKTGGAIKPPEVPEEPAGQSIGQGDARGIPATSVELVDTPDATSESELISANELPSLTDGQAIPGRAGQGVEPKSLRFNWPQRPAAAAFQRGPWLWLVFDRPTSPDLARRIEKLVPELAPVMQFEQQQSTVFRMAAPSGSAPMLVSQGPNWIVTLAARSDAPDQTVPVVADRSSARPSVVLPLKAVGRLIDLTDPDVGDRLYVVPLHAAGIGLAKSRSFPEFRLLATRQGVVIQPLSDALLVEQTEDGIVVTSREGLVLSAEQNQRPRPAAESAAPKGRDLLDLVAWRRGRSNLFVRNKQDLQRAVIEAQGHDEALARLDLARFYFAHGLARETLAALDLLLGKEKTLADDPQVLLMKAGSEFLTGDYEAAEGSLSHPALAGEPEAVVWDAAAAAIAHNWEHAVARFIDAAALIPDYPRDVRARLRLLAAEARLAVADTGGASQYLSRVRGDQPNLFERAQMDYLEGRRLYLEDTPDQAAELWHRVAEGVHTPSAARARLALIELGVEQGSLEPDDAIAELERLRFAWRGDDFELTLLLRLADLYLERYDYRNGLIALRAVASHLTSDERSQAVTQRMREVFSDLFLTDAGRNLPPIVALGLYQEFKELTPPGAKGDHLIAGLAERLVEVDLLTQAAQLLETQVRYRLQGVEKARIGARAALLRLMNQEPFDALEALKDSSMRELPADLQQQRLHLKARAFAQANIQDEALVLLTGDDSPDALRLRADIYWQKQDWQSAAKNLAKLLPEWLPPEASPSQSEVDLIISLAVAHTLADDRTALYDLNWRYGEAMEKSARSSTFAMLAGDLERVSIGSVADDLSRVATIQAFLDGYRKRLEDSGLSAIN